MTNKREEREGVNRDENPYWELTVAGKILLGSLVIIIAILLLV